jgi:hypothetical protein
MSLCPTCEAQEETYDHLLQCGHPSRVVGWKLALRTALLKYTKETHCHIIMQDILITGIHHWIHELPFPSHRFPHQHWQELITSQANIGWKQLLLGRFSTKWMAYHHQHLQQNHLTLTDFNHGEIWLRKMITIIWTHCHQLWESRNTDKHGHDSTTQRKILLEQVQRRMAVMYQLISRCYPADQTKWFFYPTLEEHIAKEPSLQQQQGWVTTYEPMI